MFFNNVFAPDAFGLGRRAQDGIERAAPQRCVIRDRQTVVSWLVRLKNDMAADLVDLAIAQWRISESASARPEMSRGSLTPKLRP
jgi:hypothetical protein